MVVCPVCDGVRAITIGTNSKICPNCKGEGTVSPPEPVKPEGNQAGYYGNCNPEEYLLRGEKPDEGLLLTEDEIKIALGYKMGAILLMDYGKVAKAQLLKLQPELDRREARIKELEAELEVIDKNYRIKKGETWYWESNDENHLESLTCPVIINADDLRKLLAEAKAEAYKEIGEWLSEWRLKEHNISSVLLDLIAKLQKGEEVG
jgi:hypothetical protein